MSTSILNLSRHAGVASKPTPVDLADHRQNRWIYALCFCVFLLATLIRRLLPHTWFKATPSGGQQLSILEEARTAAATVLPFIFMA